MDSTRYSATLTVSSPVRVRNSVPATPTAPVTVAAVKFPASSGIAIVGTQKTIPVTVIGSDGKAMTGKTIAWTSNDATKATVDANGTVTPVAAGPVAITATVDGIGASVNLAVSDAPADLDAFKARYAIGAVNSINWARVAAQVVYYFAGYFGATRANHERVSFAVPSGNFGNICAGHVARMMGLPIDRLVLATNENNVLDEFFRTGTYRVRSSAETHETSSPSMDISKASNFERFVFDLLGRDAERTRELFGATLAREGGFTLASDEFAPATRADGFGFASGSSTHADRLATIREAWQRWQTMIDTHTADGLKVALEHRLPNIPMIVLETAQPAKFEETIREALGTEPVRPADLAGIEKLPQRVVVMAPDVAAIKQFIVERV